jgi:hypothetical protein
VVISKVITIRSDSILLLPETFLNLSFVKNANVTLQKGERYTVNGSRKTGRKNRSPLTVYPSPKK